MKAPGQWGAVPAWDWRVNHPKAPQIARNQEHIQLLTETLGNAKGGQAAGNNCTLLCFPNTALKTRICHSSMYRWMNFCFLAFIVYSAGPALGQWEVLGVKAMRVSTVAPHSPPWQPLGRSLLQVQSEKDQIKKYNSLDNLSSHKLERNVFFSVGEWKPREEDNLFSLPIKKGEKFEFLGYSYNCSINPWRTGGEKVRFCGSESLIC